MFCLQLFNCFSETVNQLALGMYGLPRWKWFAIWKQTIIFFLLLPSLWQLFSFLLCVVQQTFCVRENVSSLNLIIVWTRTRKKHLHLALKGEVSWGFDIFCLKWWNKTSSQLPNNDERKEINSIFERNNSWSVLAHFGQKNARTWKTLA